MSIDRIHSLVKTLLSNKGDNDPLTSHSPLLTSGRLQSIDIITLATQLESTFGVDFSAIGFDQYQFETIESICQLLGK